MPLQIEVEDIYFITGLSRQGEVVNMNGKASKELNVDDYIVVYCALRTQKVGSQIPLKNITNLATKIFIFTISRVSR